MMRRQASIVLLIGLLVACGNKADVETAKRSLYDTDFAVVYSAALEATKTLYPSTDDMPGAGAIRTAWHQVPLASQDDMATSRAIAQSGMGNMNSPNMSGMGNSVGMAGNNAMNMPTRLAMKRYFVRFDVSVVGGRPWRVKVIGHASEWDPGAAMPTEMRGLQRPAWLDGRTDALVLAIFNKIRGHAVPMKEAPPEEDPEKKQPKTDPTTFAMMPAPAAQRLAHVKDMLTRRNYEGLREDLADDVKFSLGADGNIDVALATWQADPETFDAMMKVIGPACASDETDINRVLCPGGSPGQGPHPGTWQLVLELRGPDWKVTSFVRAE